MSPISPIPLSPLSPFGPWGPTDRDPQHLLQLQFIYYFRICLFAILFVGIIHSSIVTSC